MTIGHYQYDRNKKCKGVIATAYLANDVKITFETFDELEEFLNNVELSNNHELVVFRKDNTNKITILDINQD